MNIFDKLFGETKPISGAFNLACAGNELNKIDQAIDPNDRRMVNNTLNRMEYSDPAGLKAIQQTCSVGKPGGP
jgi:hypothetical protein